MSATNGRPEHDKITNVGENTMAAYLTPAVIGGRVKCLGCATVFIDVAAWGAHDCSGETLDEFLTRTGGLYHE